MPCDLGYRNIVDMRVNVDIPLRKKIEKFNKTIGFARIDEDLLDKIGETDPDFLDNLTAFNYVELITAALNAAKKKVKVDSKLKLSVSKNGELAATASFEEGTADKKKLEREVGELARQVAVELLSIVAQILGYTVIVNSEKFGGQDAVVIEGEKDVGTDVSRYLRIVNYADGKTATQFEHFESEVALNEETAKLLALSEALGVDMSVHRVKIDGAPIAHGAYHKGHLDNRNRG